MILLFPYVWKRIYLDLCVHVETAIIWQISPPVLFLYMCIEIYILEKVEQICTLTVPQQYTK